MEIIKKLSINGTTYSLSNCLVVTIRDERPSDPAASIIEHITAGYNAFLLYNDEYLALDHYDNELVSFVRTNVEEGIAHQVDIYNDGTFDAYVFQAAGHQYVTDIVPTKVSQLENDSGYLTDYTEADPTVPAWAKAEKKPTYTAEEVGALPNTTAIPTKVSELTNDSKFITASGAPVQSVNGKTGAVTLGAADVGARPNTWTPTYTDVGAEKSGTASSAVSTHNTNTNAHNDIRLLITALTTRLDALANSDDTTLDQMAEVVAYIKDNRNLIEQITTGKVSVADIVNNLTTNVTNKPLSAAQGVALKALIDAITVPTKVSQLTNDKGYITGYTETDPTVPSWAKASSKPSYSKSEVGLGNVDNVKQYSASNPPPYPVTSVNGKTGAVTLSAADVSAVPTSSALTVTGVDADGATHTWTMYGVKN